MKLTLLFLLLASCGASTTTTVDCTPPDELFDCHPEANDAGTHDIVCADGDGVTQWRFRGSDTQIHEVIVDGTVICVGHVGG